MQGIILSFQTIVLPRISAQIQQAKLCHKKFEFEISYDKINYFWNIEQESTRTTYVIFLTLISIACAKKAKI
jgi:hypothetical protein